MQAAATKYAAELATLTKLTPAVRSALESDPTDQQAAINALSELTGLSTADVTTVATLASTDGPALSAAQAIDPSTASALHSNPSDPSIAQQAVDEIMAKLKVSAAVARASLVELSKIPTAQLVLASQDGPKIVDAANQLKALSRVPAKDLALLETTLPDH